MQSLRTYELVQGDLLHHGAYTTEAVLAGPDGDQQHKEHGNAHDARHYHAVPQRLQSLQCCICSVAVAPLIFYNQIGRWRGNPQKHNPV